MLSEENILKLCMTEVYRCDPVKEWLPSYKRDTPYHCCNWTFQARKFEDNYYIVDTYWCTDSMTVKLTDDNFDIFEFLFDMNEVTRISPPDFYDYDEKDR